MQTNPRKYSLDEIDYRILTALQKDGRLSYVQLAEKVGLSESACLRRVKLLEQSGIIGPLRHASQPGRCGENRERFFVRVSLEGQQHDKLLQFEKEIGRVKEVMECYLMSGDSDYLLRIIIDDNDDYLRIHNRLTAITGVLRVQSSFALKTVIRKTEIALP